MAEVDACPFREAVLMTRDARDPRQQVRRLDFLLGKYWFAGLDLLDHDDPDDNCWRLYVDVASRGNSVNLSLAFSNELKKRLQIFEPFVQVLLLYILYLFACKLACVNIYGQVVSSGRGRLVTLLPPPVCRYRSSELRTAT